MANGGVGRAEADLHVDLPQDPLSGTRMQRYLTTAPYDWAHGARVVLIYFMLSDFHTAREVILAPVRTISLSQCRFEDG